MISHLRQSYKIYHFNMYHLMTKNHLFSVWEYVYRLRNKYSLLHDDYTDLKTENRKLKERLGKLEQQIFKGDS